MVSIWRNRETHARDDDWSQARFGHRFTTTNPSLDLRGSASHHFIPSLGQCSVPRQS
jgi:hypothetical protein